MGFRIDGNGNVVGGPSGTSPKGANLEEIEAKKVAEELSNAFKTKQQTVETTTGTTSNRPEPAAKFTIPVTANININDVKAQIEALQDGESFEVNGVIYTKDGDTFVNPKQPSHEVKVHLGEVLAISEIEQKENSDIPELHNQLVMFKNGDVSSRQNTIRPNGCGDKIRIAIKNGVKTVHTENYYNFSLSKIVDSEEKQIADGVTKTTTKYSKRDGTEYARTTRYRIGKHIYSEEELQAKIDADKAAKEAKEADEAKRAAAQAAKDAKIEEKQQQKLEKAIRKEAEKPDGYHTLVLENGDRLVRHLKDSYYKVTTDNKIAEITAEEYEAAIETPGTKILEPTDGLTKSIARDVKEYAKNGKAITDDNGNQFVLYGNKYPYMLTKDGNVFPAKKEQYDTAVQQSEARELQAEFERGIGQRAYDHIAKNFDEIINTEPVVVENRGVIDGKKHVVKAHPVNINGETYYVWSKLRKDDVGECYQVQIYNSNMQKAQGHFNIDLEEVEKNRKTADAG